MPELAKSPAVYSPSHSPAASPTANAHAGVHGSPRSVLLCQGHGSHTPGTALREKERKQSSQGKLRYHS